MVTASGTAALVTRRRVLNALRELSCAAPLADIAAAVGRRPNTVREHLDALVADGRAEVENEHSGVRGRPRALYRATPLGVLAHDPGADSARLAAIVLTAFGQDETTARATTNAAGARWGKEVARALGGIGSSTERLTTALEAAGAEPHSMPPESGDVGCVHVAQCPFQTQAAVRPDVVCGVHAAMLKQLVEDGEAVTIRHDPTQPDNTCVITIKPSELSPAPSPMRKASESGAGP